MSLRYITFNEPLVGVPEIAAGVRVTIDRPSVGVKDAVIEIVMNAVVSQTNPKGVLYVVLKGRRKFTLILSNSLDLVDLLPKILSKARTLSTSISS